MPPIYFDNAATAPLHPLVAEQMAALFHQPLGNASAIHAAGRVARLMIENARKSVARNLNVSSSEIFFTSGGTEANNMAIMAAIEKLDCQQIITSALEHPSVLKTIEHIATQKNISVQYISLLSDGAVDYEDIEKKLSLTKQKTLVCLMHANNEVGNISDINLIGEICKKHEAIFFTDAVQTIGHLPIDLSKTPVDILSSSAHKFRGPLGAGFIFIRKNIGLAPILRGGNQERNLRAGTENIYGIVGLAKALDIATEQMQSNQEKIFALKKYFWENLQSQIPDVTLAGEAIEKTLYTILSVQFPKTDKSEALLYNLDINNIYASQGSACSSGANKPSAIAQILSPNDNKIMLRFSFNENNTIDEVDRTIKIVRENL